MFWREAEKLRNSKNRKTYDFSDTKYSPELIRQYENPEYAKAAAEYEKNAKKKKKNKNISYSSDEPPTLDEFEAMLQSEYGIDAEIPERSRHRKKGKKEKKRYKWNKLKIFRNILIVILILMIAAVGVMFAATSGFDRDKTSENDFLISPEVQDSMSDYRNILILGSDARAGQPIENSRTDAIIVMSINKKNNDVTLISIMRDSYLNMYYGEDSILDKLTHAHAFGGGVNTAAAINRSLDMNIDEYIVFNWQAVSDTVDTLGGIEIDVKEDEIEDLNHYGNETAKNVGGTFNEITSPGVQTLDGVQATTYCRIRKTSGGDQGRTGRYKKILAGVMKKAVKNPLKAGEIVKTISPNISTNMSQTDMVTAAVRAPLFDMKKSISWPFDYYSGLLNDGVAYVVPQTLESNVTELHEKAFGQPGYILSGTAEGINQWIIEDTGIY